MNLKKFFTATAMVVLSAVAVSFIHPKTATVYAEESINSLAKKQKYVGTSYLYQILAAQNITYNKFYTQNKIEYRNGKPEGIVIHETADPGATAMNEAIYFNREWPNMYAYVHAFIYSTTVIQMMTPDYGAWGAGPMANDRFIHIELCEEDNRADFIKSVNNDAIYTARLLHRYNLKPVNATHDGKGTIWSHAAVSKFLGGTDHGDPDGYFAKWGYSMDQFFDLVKYYYDLQNNKNEPTKKDNPEDNITKIPDVKKGETTLMHDAYVYDAKGKRVKNKAVKRAGTAVNIIDAKMINKTKYYQIAKNEYINAANIDGTLRLLVKNSYIYDTVGVKTGNTKLLKDSKVKTYGSAVKIAGESYYAIGATQFVKTDNFKAIKSR